jgi:hypothetical protein
MVEPYRSNPSPTPSFDSVRVTRTMEVVSSTPVALTGSGENDKTSPRTHEGVASSIYAIPYTGPFVSAQATTLTGSDDPFEDPEMLREFYRTNPSPDPSQATSPPSISPMDAEFICTTPLAVAQPAQPSPYPFLLPVVPRVAGSGDYTLPYMARYSAARSSSDNPFDEDDMAILDKRSYDLDADPFVDPVPVSFRRVYSMARSDTSDGSSFFTPIPSELKGKGKARLSEVSNRRSVSSETNSLNYSSLGVAM